MEGISYRPDAIVVDAGSTDAGPHKLGAGVSIVSKQACKKDLELMIAEGAKAGIPVIIGSAGGSGGRVHVEWTCEIIVGILKEQQLERLKTAVIWADIDKAEISRRMAAGQVKPLGASVKELTADRLERTNAVVAQMGHEPIVKALEAGADIIVCGRAYDPSPFAAVAVYHQFPLAYGYHAGKILECAALCAEPGTTKDCMLGVIREDGFLIIPMSDRRRCTPASVAAHTFYEKSHPYHLSGPGFMLDLEHCRFEQYDEKSVFVSGSRIEAVPYTIKLEGALRTAYRTFVIGGVRDPVLIQRLEQIEQLAEQEVRKYYQEVTEEYQINFINYGLNGVLGQLESEQTLTHEVGVVFEVIAPTQDIANMICGSLRSTLLHYGYEGRKSTAGNLAFPFAPSDISFGAVYEFSVYHLMEVEDPLACFPIEYNQLPERREGIDERISFV